MAASASMASGMTTVRLSRSEARSTARASSFAAASSRSSCSKASRHPSSARPSESARRFISSVSVSGERSIAGVSAEMPDSGATRSVSPPFMKAWSRSPEALLRSSMVTSPASSASTSRQRRFMPRIVSMSGRSSNPGSRPERSRAVSASHRPFVPYSSRSSLKESGRGPSATSPGMSACRRSASRRNFAISVSV